MRARVLPPPVFLTVREELWREIAEAGRDVGGGAEDETGWQSTLETRSAGPHPLMRKRDEHTQGLPQGVKRH